ncbi:hypothetical protein Plhal703r1_c28g0112541 [Plasmopara halstedii]
MHGQVSWYATNRLKLPTSQHFVLEAAIRNPFDLFPRNQTMDILAVPPGILTVYRYPMMCSSNC